MKKVYIVITNCGDGSNYLEWHKTMSTEKSDKLLEDDPERYGSGDGFQCQEVTFPDNFDLELLAHQNHIYWYEDEFAE